MFKLNYIYISQGVAKEHLTTSTTIIINEHTKVPPKIRVTEYLKALFDDQNCTYPAVSDFYKAIDGVDFRE